MVILGLSGTWPNRPQKGGPKRVQKGGHFGTPFLTPSGLLPGLYPNKVGNRPQKGGPKRGHFGVILDPFLDPFLPLLAHWPCTMPRMWSFWALSGIWANRASKRVQKGVILDPPKTPFFRPWPNLWENPVKIGVDLGVSLTGPKKGSKKGSFWGPLLGPLFGLLPGLSPIKWGFRPCQNGPKRVQKGVKKGSILGKTVQKRQGKETGNGQKGSFLDP